VVLGAFWPMARFAVGPAGLLVAAMPALSRRALAWCVAVALATNVSLLAFSHVPSVDALSPVSTIPVELHDAAAMASRFADGPVWVEPGPAFEHLLVAYLVGTEHWRLLPREERPARIVTFEGGRLDAALKATGEVEGLPFRRIGGAGTVSWWDAAE
jgi:hypothetical protein